MKKVIAVLVIALFIIVGCHESSSIVAPNNSDVNLEKKSDATEFVPTEVDSNATNGQGRPALPRV
ncbi:MAG: hypothetical protein H6612_07925 [Ignavibacteriales bacterium]|nr:hypothetical protein [Ignavibacteriales bacterium]MCB9211333.1 hypothetical protein [Ignavibacteriales bacterium]MCB9259269.1 hypothetical protein [Ignavibacteriales bacterium]